MEIDSKSDPVLASVVWDIAPTIDYLINQVANGVFSSSKINSFSLPADSGRPLTWLDTKIISPALAQKVADQLHAIQIGVLKLDFSDQEPPKVTLP
jgi:basic membrane lipoprotein Med (substrate-binding protein (PBP1-ABC) superfamily)